MTKNTPEALQKIVENLRHDLIQNDDCSKLLCRDCPLHLQEPEKDFWGATSRCGWLILVTATSKILRK